MKGRDILANYPISLAQLKKITQISDIKSDDEVTDYGWGFIDGYLRCEQANNIARAIPKKPIKKKIEVSAKRKSSPTKQNSKRKNSQKKKKGKSVWTISVPMGGMNKWSRRKRRINS